MLSHEDELIHLRVSGSIISNFGYKFVAEMELKIEKQKSRLKRLLGSHGKLDVYYGTYRTIH